MHKNALETCLLFGLQVRTPPAISMPLSGL